MLKFFRKNYLILVVFTILLHLILLVKFKFTAWPEMLLWPYLNIHGWQIYRDIAIAHTPLLLWKLDIFYALFGAGILQLKIFTWSLILFFDLLLYFISIKLWGRKIAMVALGFFVFWQVFFEGNGLWFDLFMGGISLITFYFVQTKKWFWAGLLLALAVISKQTAIWFLVPILFSAWDKWPEFKKRLMGLALGGIPVLILFMALLLLFRILPDFWNWAVNFGIFELPRAQGQIQLPDLKNLAISLFPFTIFLPLFLIRKKDSLSLFLWGFAGLMGAYPRFEYFHFQPAVFYLAIASALVFTSAWHKRDFVKAFIPIYALGSLYLFGGFFMRNWNEGTRFYETDVQDVVSYVKSNTRKDDKIFVLNYWDSVYTLSSTQPATDPWIPQLSWYMDKDGIQEAMINGLKETRPKFIVFNPYLETGLGSYKPVKVFNYIAANYRLKDKVDGIEILIPK